jgi:hypothetical protein
MHPPVGRLILIVVGCIALSCIGCKSNNEGKIVGKWKLTAATDMASKQFNQLEMVNVYVFIEFRSDHTVTIGAESSDPNVQRNKALMGKLESLSKTCKYRLRSGDVVEFYDMPKDMQNKADGTGLFGANKDRARTRAKINGDSMNWNDDDNKNFNFVRIK